MIERCTSRTEPTVSLKYALKGTDLRFLMLRSRYLNLKTTDYSPVNAGKKGTSDYVFVAVYLHNIRTKIYVFLFENQI